MGRGRSKNPDPFLGTTLKGTYRIDELVGEGGMGAVYAATHLRLGSRVAIKFLRIYRIRDAGMEEGVHRFRREARVAMELNDENIVHIHDYDITPDETPYIVMEYLEGEDLDRLIMREAPLPLDFTVEILGQIASALTAAHGRNVVHRDLKPGNIFLKRRATGETVVKVVDFGIAKLLGSKSLKTRPNSVMGTPHFMAPEQASAEDREVDERADIFSLGCILYSMLCKKMPFPGSKYSQVLLNLMMNDPTPPRELRPELPHAVEQVILKALSKKREDRHRTARELARDFEAAAAAAEAPGRSATLAGPPPARPISTRQVRLTPTAMDTVPVGEAQTIPPPDSTKTDAPSSLTGLDTPVVCGVPTESPGHDPPATPARPPARPIGDTHTDIGSTPTALDNTPREGRDDDDEAETVAETVSRTVPPPGDADGGELARGPGGSRAGYLAMASLLLLMVAGGYWLSGGIKGASSEDASPQPRDARAGIARSPDSAVVPDARPPDLERRDQAVVQKPEDSAPRRRWPPARALLNVVPRGASGPVSATVFLDGRKLGEAPRQFRVPPGRHMLRVFKPGYPPVLKELRLRPGQKTKVIVPLGR